MPVAPRLCCLDLDTFFVSVERLLDPSLVGKPVVVGGMGGRGVVTSASYEVRAYGVRSGMSIGEAQRLAPDAVFVPVRGGVYGEYAERVRAVLERYSPCVQTASIDEFFIDFRGCEALFARPADADGDATIARVVREMREAVYAETSLPASAGVGATRAIAKIASGRAKPAGVCVVAAGAERAFVEALPVRKFPGIGPKAEERLFACGIERLGQLVDLPAGPVRNEFARLVGAVRAAVYPVEARDLAADRPAFQEHDAGARLDGTLSNERTFREDLSDPLAIADQLRALSERVCWRARKRGLRARTITLKLKYADFQVVSRARSVPPTDAEDRVLACALALFREARTRKTAVRLLGLQLSNWDMPDAQPTLPFAPSRPRVGPAIDAVRERFGYDAIRLGATPRDR